MVVLNWTPQSILYLTNISEFIAKDSPKYAIITIRKIKKLAKQLKLHSFFGRKLPKINQTNIREIIFGNYRIIYKIISDERIDILTVHHSAKRLSDIL